MDVRRSRSCPPHALLLVALLPIGCKGGGTGGPIAVTPAMYRVDKTLVDVADGDEISLEFPPQGGHVLFVGARVRGLEDDLAELRGRLRNPDDDTIIAEEGRTVAFDPSPDDPGLKIPDLRNYANVANVAVCPSYTGLDHSGRSFILEVTVTGTSSNQIGSATRLVVPTCQQADPTERQYCVCDCAANYFLGKCS